MSDPADFDPADTDADEDFDDDLDEIDPEREAIERDRDLAWELYEAQPRHPRIPQLAHGVLARAPEFTGMVILLAMHREACGDIEEARRLLQELMARRDRQYVNAVKQLRDLEFGDRRYAEALRLGELVLRENPEASWLDDMMVGSATVFAVDPEAGWRLIDEAVERCARTDPDRYAGALGQRALRFLASGAPAERFLPAAQEAVEADPTDRSIATALAFAYLYDYRPEQAAELLGRLLREDPTDEIAQSGMTMARAFLSPLERGDATLDDFRRAGMGEFTWRVLRDQLFDTGLAAALAALDAVLPDDLARSLRPPLDEEAVRGCGGDRTVLAWHDGQQPGTGGLWGTGERFRLMTGAEVDEMDAAIERDPEAWPQWDAEADYYTQLFTDDAGAYLIEASGGRLYLRTAGEPDREVAPSLADWIWDRVVAFGGRDPRPGRAAPAEARSAAGEPAPAEAGPAPEDATGAADAGAEPDDDAPLEQPAPGDGAEAQDSGQAPSPAEPGRGGRRAATAATTARILYADKVGAGPEHPAKRWGLFGTELTPEEAAARYALNAVRRQDWFGIVRLEPGEERPRAYLMMSPRANGVVLDKLNAHGSIEASYLWRAYFDPQEPQPSEGAEERVFLSGITWYAYPDEERFLGRGDALGHVTMQFLPDGSAKEERVTRRGLGEPSEVETREHRDVDVSANWFRIPEFGDWHAFFHPESAA